MEKIIFLDIDGVLNIIEQGRDKFGSCFHKHLEDNLRWVIEQTGAKIVITSSWKTDGLSEMQKMWKYRNLAGEVIDITPHLGFGIKRGFEIQKWIDDNNVTCYCIIDDDNDMLPNQRNNFVRTADNSDHSDCIDIGYGLTRKCAELVIEILNR